MSFEALLVTAATWALGLGACWAAAICVAAVIEVRSSGRVALTASFGCPALVRRALLAGLGVVLAGGGSVVPVSAAPTPSGTGSRTDLGLPVPARPTGTAHGVRLRVQVRPGDSLWRLAERDSPPSASTQDVARLVADTYRANRRVIGPDPDLIHPGQHLRIPRQLKRTTEDS